MRDQFIDSLRGLAMIVMILTHVTVFFYSDHVARAIWDFSNFSVPIFVFCSMYLFFKKKLHKNIEGFSYLKKRLLRLVVPYYIFLIFFIPILWLIRPEAVNLKYILQSLFIIGGVDINWLVLLFLYFTLLSPLLIFLVQKHKTLFWGGFVLSLLSSVVFLWYVPNISYKLIMWIPWAVMLYFTFIYLKLEHQKKKLILLFGIAALVCIGAYSYRLFTGQNVEFIHNKYPPNIFYLSYGAAVFLLVSFFMKQLQSEGIVAKILHYFSVNSYPIYFIHYIILTIFVAFLPTLRLHWIILFFLVITMTVIVRQIISYAQKVTFKLKSNPRYVHVQPEPVHKNQ